MSFCSPTILRRLLFVLVWPTVWLAGCGEGSSPSSNCSVGESRECPCDPSDDPGVQHCDADGEWGSCVCPQRDGAVQDGAVDAQPDARPDGAPDGAPADFCDGKSDGTHCDGSDLVICLSEDPTDRTFCERGCEDSDPNFDPYCRDACNSFIDGKHCDGNDLLLCVWQREAYRVTCPASCIPGNLFNPSRCEAVPFCTTLPGTSSDPPQPECPFDQFNIEDHAVLGRTGTTLDFDGFEETKALKALLGAVDQHRIEGVTFRQAELTTDDVILGALVA